MGLYLELLLLSGRATIGNGIIIAVFGLFVVPIMIRMAFVSLILMFRLCTNMLGIAVRKDTMYYLHPLIAAVKVREVESIEIGQQFIFPFNRRVVVIKLKSGKVRRMLMSLLAERDEELIRSMRRAIW